MHTGALSKLLYGFASILMIYSLKLVDMSIYFLLLGWANKLEASQESLPIVLYDFLANVKAAPHQCVIRTGQP